MAGSADSTVASECRQCCSFCDRVVHPSGCVAAECAFLYLYDDELSGRRYMGCMNKVFGAEIDVGLFEEAERTRQGYGGVKLGRSPLPQCQIAVEQAYEGEGSAFECVNPGFFEAPTRSTAPSPAFDLRDRL